MQTPFTHKQTDGGCSAQSRTRREPSLQHTSNSPNCLLIFSLGSTPVSLEEGYYHLEALYTSSLWTLLSHFPWAGSHFRFASWASAPGLIPAPEPSSMSERAGWSRGTLQCALAQVVLGKVLPDFCKEVESDSIKAEWWQSCDFQLLLMFVSWWVACLRIFLMLVVLARSYILVALPILLFRILQYLWLKILLFLDPRRTPKTETNQLDNCLLLSVRTQNETSGLVFSVLFIFQWKHIAVWYKTMVQSLGNPVFQFFLCIII